MEFRIEDLYQKFFRDVYLFIFSISKDSHIAEDITQETFLRAMKEIKHFRGDCSVKTWLCQIAKNLYFSQMRKKKDFAYDDAVLQKKSFQNVEMEYIEKEQAGIIYQIFRILEEPYKEVFFLRIFGELSFREIGDIYEKTESWARVTYHRARLKIKEELERKE